MESFPKNAENSILPNIRPELMVHGKTVDSWQKRPRLIFPHGGLESVADLHEICGFALQTEFHQFILLVSCQISHIAWEAIKILQLCVCRKTKWMLRNSVIWLCKFSNNVDWQKRIYIKSIYVPKNVAFQQLPSCKTYFLLYSSS